MDTAKRGDLYPRRTHAGRDLTPRGGDSSQLLVQRFKADSSRGYKPLKLGLRTRPCPTVQVFAKILTRFRAVPDNVPREAVRIRAGHL